MWWSTLAGGSRDRRDVTRKGCTPPCASERRHRLLRRLQQMEMRAAASTRPRVGPPRDDFRIGYDLVRQQQQGDIGELLEQMITNFPGQALPFAGIHGLRQLQVALVDEGILKMMHRAFTPIRDPNPFFGRPQPNDVGPDRPSRLLV